MSPVTTVVRQRGGPRTEPYRVIRASAGTGKTYALSNHYLRLLCDGVEPEQILATTFTRKAAGEILSRVLSRLANAAKNREMAEKLGLELELKDAVLDLDEVRQMLERVVRSLHRVSISTIDSFFNRLTQCFRLELGLPLHMVLAAESDPPALRVRRAAIEAMMAGEEPRVLIDLLRRLHHDAVQRRTTDAIDDIVSELYEVYRQTTAEAWSAVPQPTVLSTEQLAQAIHVLATISNGNEIHGLAAPLERNYRTAEAHDWQGFLHVGLTPKIVAATQPLRFRQTLIPDHVAQAYEPLIAHARAVLVRRFAQQTKATYQLLERFDRHYSRLRRLHRVLLFSDLPYLLTQALPSDGGDVLENMYRRLDARVTHLLLDEFQDTSPQQWQVLRPFAPAPGSAASEFEIGPSREGEAPAEPSHYGKFGSAGASPSRGQRGESIKPTASRRAGTFFCVGDGKQAIYGWRGGSAEIFDQVEHDLRLPDTAVQTYTTSWRCSNIVLEAVNRVFKSLGTSTPLAEVREHVIHWQKRFQRHAARHRDRPGYVELVESLPDACATENDGEGIASSAPTAHEQFVAQRIATLSHHAPGRTVGVLLRTNRAVQRLIYLLRRLDVAASGEGGTPITDDPAVEVVLSALTMADHPGHSAAAFHVLHSPLAAVIALESRAEAQVAAVGRQIRLELMRRGFAQVITQWVRGISSHCTRRNIDRLSQLIELAGRYDPSVTIRVRDFVDYIEAAVVDDPSAAPIRVMTIHTAKGLEFDIVVLAELEKRIGQVHTSPVWTYRPQPTEPPSAVFRSANRQVRPILEASCPTLGAAYDQELGRRLDDDLSALYVAMTRPRFALHMILEPDDSSASGLSFAAILRHALGNVVPQPQGEGVLYANGDRRWHTRCPDSIEVRRPADEQAPLRINLVSSKALQSRSWQQVSPSSLESGGRVDVNQLLAVEPSTARTRGSVIHAWFAQIGWVNEPDSIPSDEVLMGIGRDVAPSMPTSWFEEQLRSFRSILDEPEVRATLSKSDDAEDVYLWRERAFAVRTDEHLLRGQFDRVVLCRRDGRVSRAQLIDYKTDVVSNARDIPIQLIEAYRPQIGAYREALCGMLRLDPDQVGARLLFVSAGVAVDLSVG